MFVLHAADIPEEEARYWAKKLEQLNAMRDQDVSSLSLQHLLSMFIHLFALYYYYSLFLKATAYSTSYPSLFTHLHNFF